MAASIVFNINSLWDAYSNGASSGRFECPITIMTRGQKFEVTHIYKGFGKIRLEHIDGAPIKGKKGFQGDDVTPIEKTFTILD